MLPVTQTTFAEALSAYIGISQTEVTRWLSLAPHKIYNDPLYQFMVNSLDSTQLGKNLMDARRAYKYGMLSFQEQYADRYCFSNTLMPDRTLGNWLIATSAHLNL